MSATPLRIVSKGKIPTVRHSRLRNEFLVDSLRQVADTSRFVAIFHYNDPPKSWNVFRDALAAKGMKLLFIKNTLARQGFLQSRVPFLSKLVGGPMVILHTDTESPNNLIPESSRYGLEVFKKFANPLEKTPDFMFIGGILDGHYVDRKRFLELCKSNPMEQELGMTMSKFPMYTLPDMLGRHQKELSRILMERAKSLDETQ